MRFIYYQNKSLYVTGCALCDITKMSAGMCLNTFYMILLKWKLLCVSIRFTWYY